MRNLETAIKEQARSLGFELVGIAPATPADSLQRLHEWLDRGFAGEMNYMQAQAKARESPESILSGVRSVVMVGMNYKPMEDCETEQPIPSGSLRPLAKVARYARGLDYHEILWDRLNRLLDWLRRERPECRGRGVVDTAPLLERDFARRAGLGWFGKNTMLINKRLGSYFFLGALLTDLELQPDAVHESSHCGSCTACLDACPTNAFVEPGMLDSRRCISYLTIELRGSIPSELRPGIGEWLFGCDVCQEVCPWNRKAPAGGEPALQMRDDIAAIEPVELLSLSPTDFRHRFRGTAFRRTKRSGLLRNAAIVVGNSGNATAIPALERALTDPDEIVREAAAWAIEQLRQR